MTASTFEVDERDQFLSEPQIAVVGTAAADGLPHLSPVWYRWDGAAFHFAFGAGGVKHQQLIHDPRLTVCVDKRGWPYASIVAACEATVGEPHQGYPLVLAERYLDGQHLRSFADENAETTWVDVLATPIAFYGHVRRHT